MRRKQTNSAIKQALFSIGVGIFIASVSIGLFHMATIMAERCNAGVHVNTTCKD